MWSSSSILTDIVRTRNGPLDNGDGDADVVIIEPLNGTIRFMLSEEVVG